jgi:4'-phosphopantetheinyl transferase
VAWDLIRTMLPDPATRITNECDRCGQPHGRVRVHRAGLHASVAYAGDLAIACVADAADLASVGIDAEPEHDGRRDRLGMTGLVRPGELTTVRDWTRIEAVLKADGRGLRVDPSAVRVSEPREDGAGAWSATIDGSDRVFRGIPVAGPPGIVLSLAVQPLSAEAQAAAADRATP